MRDELLFERITGSVIGAFFEVYNTIKSGHLESVYRNAMAVELQIRDVQHVLEKPLSVRYKGKVVGEYRPDILVETCVVVELKAGSSLDPSAFAQLMNYLCVTGYRVGLLLHFGPTPTFHRVVNGA